jgi:uncharacterized protein YqgV (UPF0045/DUF77 family)
MFIAAQVSIYPLRQPSLSNTINESFNILKQYDLEVVPGTMSSVISGDEDTLFTAIKDVMHKTSEKGEIVMIVTFSNTCPVPRPL